jgi:hypothetical protein
MASVGILSILEPSLGVINASLPLLRPVVMEVRDILGFKSMPQSHLVIHGSPFGQSIGSRWMRTKINDPFPLDTIVTRDDRSDEEHKKRLGVGDDYNQLIQGGALHSGENEKRSQIAVRTDWEVSSTGEHDEFRVIESSPPLSSRATASHSMPCAIRKSVEATCCYSTRTSIGCCATCCRNQLHMSVSSENTQYSDHTVQTPSTNIRGYPAKSNYLSHRVIACTGRKYRMQQKRAAGSEHGWWYSIF